MSFRGRKSHQSNGCRRHLAEHQVSLEKDLRTRPSRSKGPSTMQRVRSDPMLLQLALGGQHKRNKYNPNVGTDDDPVHAGAYSVRPNRNESLVFLKKLVTHQQGDNRQLESLMSPPDSPLCKCVGVYCVSTMRLLFLKCHCFILSQCQINLVEKSVRRRQALLCGHLHQHQLQ